MPHAIETPTTKMIKEKISAATQSIFEYESSVGMLKGLNCNVADEMIESDRTNMVEKLGELHSLLTALVLPQPVNMVQMAEMNCLSLNTSI